MVLTAASPGFHRSTNPEFLQPHAATLVEEDQLTTRSLGLTTRHRPR